MEKKTFLAPTPVSRELKGKVKAYAWARGFRSESCLIEQAVIELMERGAGPASPVPPWVVDEEKGKVER